VYKKEGMVGERMGTQDWCDNLLDRKLSKDES
jgi:hypothetical protein